MLGGVHPSVPLLLPDIDKLKLAQNVAHSTTVAADGGVDEPAFGGRTLETGSGRQLLRIDPKRCAQQCNNPQSNIYEGGMNTAINHVRGSQPIL